MTTRITVKNTFCLLASIATLFAFAFWLTLPQQAIAEDEGTPALMAGGTSFDLSQQNAGGLSFVSLSGDSVVGSGTNPSAYTIYVRDGDTTTVTLTVKNDSEHDIEFATMTGYPSFPAAGEDEDAFEPITFPPYGYWLDQAGQATGATYIGGQYYYPGSDTRYYQMPGYLIEAGATASFQLKVDSGDFAAGDYTWNIQLGRIRYDYEWRIVTVDPTLSYYDTFFLGEEIEDVYSAQIPLKVRVYNQPNASIVVGENSGTGYAPVITPVSSIDFGTIDLGTATGGALTDSRSFTAYNASPQNVLTDSHGNSTSITTYLYAESFLGGELDYWGTSPFAGHAADAINNNGNALPPVITSGGSTTYQMIDYEVVMDATDMIAGTYTGNLVTSTIPHKVTFNGGAGNATGEYRIPFTVTLTGTNPRLLPRATNLTATPANGYVELTWTPGDGAGQYTTYTIYRREGTETQTNPDRLNWRPYEEIGTKTVGSDDELFYLDGDVENGTTYSYTVICGSPYRGYAAVPASATPSSSIQSKMLAPGDVWANGNANYIELSWEMNELYGGDEFDGAGMVDHFNIYRDGVLVDVIYQSAVQDDVSYGWHDDGTGTGTSIYGPMSHSYGWVVNEPVPELYVPYSWQVSAVSPSGVESYLSEASPEEAYADGPVILGHEAWFDDRYYVYANLEEFNDVPAIAIKVDARVGFNSAEELRFWRSVGTTPPDTSQTPYITVTGGYNTAYGDANFADKNVVAGQTYTYTVRAMDVNGRFSDFYTFTVRAIKPTPDDYFYFASPVVTWSIIGGTTANLRFTSPSNTTARIFRNGVDQHAVGVDDYWGHYFNWQDNPGTDGTYTYRVEYTENSTGIKTSREFTFVRNTGPVDTSSLLKPPDAPVLTGRTSGERNVVLNWTPALTGGTPEGYHIYRSDADQQVTSGHYESVYHWDGNTDAWRSWGNGRYMSIAGGDILTFVDGSSGYYKGDKYLGRIEGINWNDDHMPHVYYITAYNRAGESAPSQVVVFDTNEKDEWGNSHAPAHESLEAPVKPVIDDVWVDWEEHSSYRYGFDSAIGGKVRVAWSDPLSDEAPDSWALTYEGTVWFSSPQTDSLTLYEALLDPTTKLGTSEDAPYCSVSAEGGDDGELNHTLTVTVAAENSVGTTTSEAAQITIRSFPRFYALPDNGGSLLRWTDLFNDPDTQVTGWEIWRKAEYGLWERVADASSLPAPGAYNCTDKEDNNHALECYEWADAGLDNGWVYQYKVVAKCADGVDRPSSVSEVTPQATAAVEAPGAPRNLTAQVVNGVVMLSWDEPATGGAVGRYWICRDYDFHATNGTARLWQGLSWVSGNRPSYIWSPSDPGTYHLFAYSASTIGGQDVPQTLEPYQIDRDGWTTWTYEDTLSHTDEMYPTHSNIVSVTITQEQIDARLTGYPGKPQPTATPGEGQVTLTWPACENTTYFEIDRENNFHPDIPDVTIAVVPGQTSYTWTDTNAEPGVRYRYVVSAHNSGNRGIYTDVYATASGQTRDEQVAARVAALIDADDFPTVAQVEAVDLEADSHGLDAYEAQVAAVREVYDSLTDKQKSYVSNAAKQKLQSVEAAIVAKKFEAIIAPVQALIDGLPSASVIAGADEESLDGFEIQIVAARSAYNGISPAEAKQGVDISKLEAAERALAAARQRIADQKAADAVSAQIEDLPEADDLSSNDHEAFEAQRASIVAARDAFNGLSVAQRELVDAGALEKLAACEARVSVLEKYYADAEAAAPVVALIDALPDPASNEFTLADAGFVALARTQYEGLTADQQAFIRPDQLDKLAACEARIEELKAELAQMEAAAAAGFVGDMIGAIPNIDDLDAMTLVSRPAVQEARDAFELLSDDAKALVAANGQLAKLEAAEARIARLEADEVGALIASLPDVDKITLDDEAAVVAAREAFDALTEVQRGYLADAAQPHLEAAEARIEQLKAEAAEAARIDISGGQAQLSATSFTYDGKAHKPSVTLAVGGKTLTVGTDFTVDYARFVNAGQATATLSGIGAYKGTLEVRYTIKKAASALSAKAKSKQIKAKAKNLKRKKQVIKKVKAFVVKGAHGKVTFKKLKGNKKITVAASGNVTLKKKLKRGTYKVKVRVTDAGNGNYLPASKDVTIKIRVK